MKTALLRASLVLLATVVALAPTQNADGQTAQQRLDQLNREAQLGEAPQWLTFHGKSGPGKGKHVVLISGDDEYRSEQTMPMLAKILSQHHGFRCTVLFPIEPETGNVKPDHQTNIPGMQELTSADLVILGLRFRHLPDADMKYFVDYVDAGKPIIGTRTSTHAFNYPDDSKSRYKRYHWRSQDWVGGFGQQVLGDTWISHHGHHGKESCRGMIESANKDHPVLTGVTDVWGPSDVYGVRNLPKDITVLLRGAVLKGMSPDDEPVDGKKNSPMMPVAWTKGYKSKSGVDARIFCTTMGASTDFESAGLRRLVVNATYWCLGMENKIPENANVDYVDEYKPTPFGFGTFVKGLKPSDYDLKK